MRNDTSSSWLPPLKASGYAIIDRDLAEHGEVVIWATATPVPELGDTFIIESGGRAHDVAVYQLSRFQGGWSAACRVCGWV